MLFDLISDSDPVETIYVNGINKAPFHQKGGNGLTSEIIPLDKSNKVKQDVSEITTQ